MTATCSRGCRACAATRALAGNRDDADDLVQDTLERAWSRALLWRAAAVASTAFQFVREGQVNVFYWADGPFRYAITAATDRPALAKVSEEVYRQLDAGRP